MLYRAWKRWRKYGAPLTASYFVTVWKMLRKQGCVPSALTQNVKVRPDRALCKAV